MDKLDQGDTSDKFSDFYIFVATIGSGSFGKVVHAIDRFTGEEIAVKIIKKHSLKPDRILQLKQEAQILASLDHPNVIKFKHLKETNTKLFIVMEMIYGGTLKAYMDKHDISDSQAAQIMKGILQGLAYIHSRNIIHRDMKPENMLLPDFRDLSQIKIADFGLSAQFDASSMQPRENDKCGTLLYMAPEQAQSKFYSQSIDIWSCGIILWMLLTKNKHPLSTAHESASSYLKKLQNPVWIFPDNFLEGAKSLFLKLTEISPIDRYTANQALAHPWICRNKKKVPLTSFEKFKRYSELLKMKGISFAIFFACLAGDPEIGKRERKKANILINTEKTPEHITNKETIDFTRSETRDRKKRILPIPTIKRKPVPKLVEKFMNSGHTKNSERIPSAKRTIPLGDNVLRRNYSFQTPESENNMLAKYSKVPKSTEHKRRIVRALTAVTRHEV